MNSEDRITDEQGATGSREAAQMRRKHIFAVNGSSDFLDVIRELFQEEAYNVTTTNFVPHTFEQITALQPSLVRSSIWCTAHRPCGTCSNASVMI